MAKGFRRRLKAYRLLRQPQAAVVLGGASKKQPWTVEETETSLYRSRRQRARRSPTSISRRSRDARAAAELITGDEARRIAANIAKVPELLTLEAAPVRSRSMRAAGRKPKDTDRTLGPNGG